MTRGRLLLFVTLPVVVVLALAIVGALYFAGEDQITAASIERIRPGMTRADVAKILEGVRPIELGAGRDSLYVVNGGRSMKRRACIVVTFDEQDRVIDKAIGEESLDAWAKRILGQ